MCEAYAVDACIRALALCMYVCVYVCVGITVGLCRATKTERVEGSRRGALIRAKYPLQVLSIVDILVR
jgi:hypothetical protein